MFPTILSEKYKLDKISSLLAYHRLKFYGSCYRAKDQPVHHLLFYCPWYPEGMESGKGNSYTYIKQILKVFWYTDERGSSSIE